MSSGVQEALSLMGLLGLCPAPGKWKLSFQTGEQGDDPPSPRSVQTHGVAPEPQFPHLISGFSPPL